jgi:hypothetical protein
LYVNVLVYKTAYSTLRKATWPIQAIKDIRKNAWYPLSVIKDIKATWPIQAIKDIRKNAWYPLSVIKDIKTQHGKKKMQILLCQIENVSLTYDIYNIPLLNLLFIYFAWNSSNI